MHFNLFDYCGSVPWEKHKTIQARLKSPQPETINFRSYNLNTHLIMLVAIFSVSFNVYLYVMWKSFFKLSYEI